MTAKDRIWSIDTLRGLDMFLIMGGVLLILRVCVWLAGGDAGWHWPLAEQMYHVEWDGCNFIDVLFPLFLFIAGASWPFSLASQRRKGVGEGRIALRSVKRGATLVFLGLVTNKVFQFDFAHITFCSVLSRIGLAWMLAALASLILKNRGRIVLSVAILLGYWALLVFVPAPDAPAGAGPLSEAGNLAGWVERTLWPNHMWKFVTHPEGVLNTLPAVVTAMLGIFAGEIVRRADVSGNRRTLELLALAGGLALVALVIAYGCGSWSMPLNKKLWSSSFVCATGAVSMAALAVFYWVIDVKGFRRWTFVFRVIGMNAIVAYMMQYVVDLDAIAKFFLGGVMSLCSPLLANVILSVGHLAVCWTILWFLYKKDVFVRV